MKIRKDKWKSSSKEVHSFRETASYFPFGFLIKNMIFVSIFYLECQSIKNFDPAFPSTLPKPKRPSSYQLNSGAPSTSSKPTSEPKSKTSTKHYSPAKKSGAKSSKTSSRKTSNSKNKTNNLRESAFQKPPILSEMNDLLHYHVHSFSPNSIHLQLALKHYE